MSAVHGDRLGEAASYMEMRPGQRDNAGTLARDLTALLDRYFTQPITAINDSAAGVPNDGLPLDREAISLAVDERMFDVELVRVTDPEVGRIWLISSGTLDQVPSMRRSLQSTWVERRLPRSLVTRSLFGISLALWLVWAASIVGPLVAVWLLSVSVMYLATSRPREREALLKTWAGTLRWPIMIALTVGIHLAVMPYLGFSLSFRLAYRNVSLVIGVIALAWLLWRVITIAFGIASLFAYRRGEASARSLMLLSERVTKVVIVLLTLFALLTIAGVDTTTALAGVGLGGVAVALGAQKTVENLLGGVFLLSDQVLAVGDFCTISGRSGWIEDITLRSVRLRTVEQSLLSIPAGVLSQANIENFATRAKILVQTIVRLRYGTTAGQLQRVLDDVRKMVEEHPDVEAASARFRVVNFAAQAIEIELFAFITTADFSTFMAVREALLLRIAAIIESSGSGLARPTEFLQIEPVGT